MYFDNNSRASGKGGKSAAIVGVLLFKPPAQQQGTPGLLLVFLRFVALGFSGLLVLLLVLLVLPLACC